jgi:ATP-dependent protease Clp ATPase subunit
VDKDKCSFCGKSERFGVRLVRGPEVAICEECVALAQEAIESIPELQQPSGRVHLTLFTDSEGVGGIFEPDNE